ncbi:hypothetical protein STAFG_8181 [Streptomyces afghaniensis 772]|uniref:Uncharacterized protein n=1 Tax=Streptomyces afghaniensis 772 TaxID=1283301 RepID=S4NA71_9ACTN|nr:hypothetical protein STAFG_8181 [Streptomyces afghaniensis 772]
MPASSVRRARACSVGRFTVPPRDPSVRLRDPSRGRPASGKPVGTRSLLTRAAAHPASHRSWVGTPPGPGPSRGKKPGRIPCVPTAGGVSRARPGGTKSPTAPPRCRGRQQRRRPPVLPLVVQPGERKEVQSHDEGDARGDGHRRRREHERHRLDTQRGGVRRRTGPGGRRSVTRGEYDARDLADCAIRKRYETFEYRSHALRVRRARCSPNRQPAQPPTSPPNWAYTVRPRPDSRRIFRSSHRNH